jgi:Flp pilus assembly protein TadG
MRMGKNRRGVTVVECAIIYPITFLLILGMVIGALGVVRYQEVSALARAGARWGSTHGAQYRKDCGQFVGKAGTSTSTSDGLFWYTVDPTKASGVDTTWPGVIYDQSIRANLVGLDVTQLKVEIGWPPVINQADKPDNWPGSKVAVRVSYTWMPEAFFIGPITLTSTSVMPITN